MKATIKLENIGQKIGLQTLDFNSGVVTLITGRTAAGKSRIIKSYALALSYPIKSENLIDDGINFGILKGDDAEYLPLVNSSKDRASVELKYDGVTRKLELLKDGTIKTNELGNQKFLYVSMLVKNSRIHNRITKGKASFRWIVDEMSLAKDYEKIRAQNIDLSEELNTSIDNIKKNRDILEKKATEKKKKEVERDTLIHDQKKKEADIGTYKFDPEIVKEENRINNALEIAKGGLQEVQEAKTKFETQIESFKKQKEIDTEVKKLEEEKAEKEKKVIELKRINVQNLQKEIIHIQNELSLVEQDKVKYETQKQIWEMVEEGNECPVCKSVVKITEEGIKASINKFNDNIKSLREKSAEKTKAINKRLREINDRNELSKLQKRIKTISDKVYKLKFDATQATDKIKTLEGKIQSISPNIERYRQDIERSEKEKVIVDKKKAEDVKFQKLKNQKTKIDEKIGGVNEQLTKIKEAINNAKFVKVFDVKMENLDTAKKIIEDLKDFLEKTEIYLEGQIKEQREGAANKFNDSIKNLIKELKFDTFKEIYLDLEDFYRLKIIDSNNNPQELSSVSGGEKSIISSLLQISAKETYLSEIPFLIGDEIILDLDPIRSEIFINYLKKIAKEKDWFIILTKITKEDLEIIEI